ncbi:MAG: choice-of-anchor D domain-containing protein, partial [Myxococcota bacterium]
MAFLGLVVILEVLMRARFASSLSLVFSIIMLALLAGCQSCDGEGGLEAAEATIRTAEESVDFGMVRVGMSASQSLRVENLGSAVLDLTEISIKEGPYAEWFTVSPRSERVGVGSSREIEITFSPRDEEQAQATLVLSSNDEENPVHEVTLTGTGFIPLVDVSPLRIDFGNVVLETSKQETVSLTNNGEEAANVRIRSVTGQGSSHYRVQSPAGAVDGSFVLMPGESSEIDVTYAPTTRGRHLAAFTIEPCDGCMPAMLDLAGVGIDSGLVVEPSAIEFGAANPGSPVSQPVTFKNIGNKQVQILGLSIVSLTGGTPSQAFWVEHGELPFSLEEGDEVEVEVFFGPNDLQHHVAGLEWESSDERNQTGRIPMSGKGGGPDIELVPDVLSFGLVALGSPMPSSLVIMNNGFDRLTVSDVEILDEPAFQLVSPPSQTVLEVGEYMEVPIRFDPTVEGRHDGRVVVFSDDPDEPETYAALNGEAVNLPPCEFSVHPAEVRFGIVDRNRSRVQQFSVTNEGDDGEACLIAVLDLTPSTPDAFSLPGGEISGYLLESGDTMRVDVAFSPERHGEYEGEVEFYVSDPTAPRQTVSLYG